MPICGRRYPVAIRQKEPFICVTILSGDGDPAVYIPKSLAYRPTIRIWILTVLASIRNACWISGSLVK